MRFRPILAMLLLLSAWAMPITAQEDSDAPLQIFASHSILADVVQSVVGDNADVQSLIPRGADPHSYEAVPSDLVALAEADLVFVNGANFEEGLLETIVNVVDEDKLVVASACVPVLSFDGHHGDHDHDEEHSDDDHDEEHSDDDHDEEHSDDDHDEEHSDDDHDEEHSDDDHDEEHSDDDHDEEHSDDDHDHESVAITTEQDCGTQADQVNALRETATMSDNVMGVLSELACDDPACDPHVWMDPFNVAYWAITVHDEMVVRDSANASAYTEALNAYLSELQALHADVIMPLVATVPEENRVLVTSHDTLGYFADAYGFEVVETVIPGGSTLAEPSVADIAELITLIAEEGVPAVFGETTVSDEVTQLIAEESGAIFTSLYSGTLSESGAEASTYIEYMTFNTTAIVEALGGGLNN